MRTDNPLKSCIVYTAAKYFRGTDFHLVLETLSTATYDRVYSILKDCSVDDNESAQRDVAGEAWHITGLMAFLAELYHWDRLIDKHSNAETI